MTREDAKSRFEMFVEVDNYSKIDLSVFIDKIYDDFDKQLEEVKKEYWIKGTNDNYKALKESGKLR